MDLVVHRKGHGRRITGSLPQNVRGTGILVTSGGVYEVMPLAAGRISEVRVRVGRLFDGECTNDQLECLFREVAVTQ